MSELTAAVQDMALLLEIIKKSLGTCHKGGDN